MNTIDLNIGEAFLECHYKAHLLSNGTSGKKSEYELLLNELKEIYKRKFLAATKERSSSIKANCQIRSGKYKLTLDALESIKSQDSNYSQYIPYFVLPNEKITATQKLLAGFASLCLTDVDYQSKTARIVYGCKQKTTRVELNHYIEKSQRLLRDLEKFLNQSTEPPRCRIKHCQICEFRNSCYAEFVERDDLSLLGGMGSKQISQLNNKGIFTVNQLSYTYRPKRRKKKVVKPNRLEHSLKALALREKKTFVLDSPTFRDSEWNVYLDLEGLTDESFWYLIGLIGINKKSGKRIERSFWADKREDTKETFSIFSKTISALKDFIVFHYGNYEIKSLKIINRQLNGEYDNVLDTILNNSINVLSYFTSDIYPPTYTNGLKDIAQYIGFNWSHKNASGLQSVIWRKKWELTKDEQLKDILIEYNRNDCEALCAISKWIEDISTQIERFWRDMSFGYGLLPPLRCTEA